MIKKFRLHPRIIIIIACFGFGAIALISYISFFTYFLRVRNIDITDINEKLAAQEAAKIENPQLQSQLVVDEGKWNDKGLDSRCLSWSTKPISSGWTKYPKDDDFFIDYYIPPNKKALICATPAYTVGLVRKVRRPLIYQVYPTEYGLRIRVIIGVSLSRKTCQKIAGNPNCADSLLSQQVVVKYEP
ncbi:hypothetical protein [Calothrix sp. 336/3]|uniref:hypothetical protein n=1 Tax=Calothrix sp. 336/3 TaxID=1337936 RepID=UPI0004E44BDA|nr:hypothetical protein [Calothrix sp. 336/3]AKG22997.1 hypothetical protein IJ00_18465 [Calothrix sp. 336/3]